MFPKGVLIPLVKLSLISQLTLVSLACVTSNQTDNAEVAKEVAPTKETKKHSKIASNSDIETLNHLSLKELIHIPLNKHYSQHTIHQSDTNQIDKDSVNFGILAPISEFPVYSAEIIAAADMAASLINENGGINGRRLVILRADDKENTPVSARLARQLADEYQVEAFIGPATSESVSDVLQQVAIPRNIPLISQAASSLALNQLSGESGFWRMVANNSQQLELINNFLKDLGHQNVFLITGRDLYSNEIAAGVNSFFSQFENGWVKRLSISDLVVLAEMDLRREIADAQNNGATAIVITLVNAQVKAMIEKISRNWQGPFPIIIIGDTVTPKYLRDSELGDIGSCIISYVGTPKDLQPQLSEHIAKAITTGATGFDGAYVFDATIILSMAKVLSNQFNLSIKEAVQIITSDGHEIKHINYSEIAELYKIHRKFSYYGYSGRVLFNEKGDNLSAYSKLYSLAKSPEQTKANCINLK